MCYNFTRIDLSRFIISKHGDECTLKRPGVFTLDRHRDKQRPTYVLNFVDWQKKRQSKAPNDLLNL